jgi:hypothetical protein
MIESLNAIRSLKIAPVFEDLYFSKAVPANLQVYMGYPIQFHNTSLNDWQPLTAGGLIPIIDDGNFYDICLFDQARRKFVVKFLEEPSRIKREFDTWQQFLAYKLLEIAESGLSEEELVEVAEAVEFRRTPELLSLLREMEELPDDEIEQAADNFIEACAA